MLDKEKFICILSWQEKIEPNELPKTNKRGSQVTKWQNYSGSQVRS